MPVNTKQFAPQTHPRATRKNELWIAEIVLRDDSQRTQILIVLDVFSRLPVVLTVLDPAASTAGQLAGHVNDASQRSGRPKTLWVDVSFEFKQELDELAMRHAVDIVFAPPTPQRRSITERFLWRLARFLSENASSAPNDLNRKLAEWRQRYKASED
jgi:hypothetical protein